MLRIDIAGLSEGLSTETLHPEADTLGLDPDLFSALEVDVQLDIAARRIMASFQACALATLVCDRTLDPYTQRICGNHTLLFVPPEQITGDEPDETLRPLLDDDDEIDIGDAVRDTLLLALPLRRVAPDAEDIEIPTVFGGERDAEGRLIDDRWDALRRLRDGE